MAHNKTKYGRKHVLDHIFGRIDTPFPTNVYAALYTADPTDAGILINEVSQLGYARVEISALMGDAVLGSGQTTNSADITFPTAGEDWSEITHIGIFLGTATIGAGDMFYFGPAVTSRVVENGETYIIRAGQLTIIEY